MRGGAGCDRAVGLQGMPCRSGAGVPGWGMSAHEIAVKEFSGS